MKGRSLVLTTIALALVAAQTFTAGRQRVAAQTPPQPDFSGVSDILHGHRRLLPVDDLAITYSDKSTDPIVNVTAQTISGTVGNVSDYQLPSGGSSWFATGVGRMFDLPRDVIVTLTHGNVTIRDQNPNGAVTQSFPLNIAAAPNPGQLPMADFTGDGFADFAYILGSNIYVLTANDVTSINSGVFFSSPGAAPFDLTNKPVSLTAGDFDGDGTPEIALAVAEGKTFTIMIYGVQVTKSEGKVTAIALAATGWTSDTQPDDIQHLALVAGTYTNDVNATTGRPLEDLVVMYHYNAGQHHVNVHSFSVMTNTTTSPVGFVVKGVDNHLWQQSDHNFIGLALASDRMDFFGATDQVVAFVQETEGDNYSHLAVFTLDDTLKVSKASETIVEEPFNDQATIALGNFDQDTVANQPIDLEIAVLKSIALVDVVWLYRVDPAKSFALDHYNTSAPVAPGSPYVTLRAGDTQGRSLLLGEPTKLTVQHTQPRIVLGMPPMHVDWVTPAGGSEPEVLNLSAVKGGFFSSYQTTQTDQNQSSSQGTTSFSHAVSETISAGYRWGNEDTGSVNVQVTENAGFLHSNTVSKQYDTYDSKSFDVSTGTGFDDNVWFNDERHNVYVYPVIGHVSCPEGKPDCSAGEKVPLVVMFSGPDQIVQEDVSGGTLEWFQPVWEPGNIFSYPWNLEQLEAQYPSVSLLTSSQPTEFFTDGSTLTEQAKWEGQTGSTSTTGSTNNVWWGTSVSVSRTPSKVTGGFSGSASLSYNGSASMSTLNTHTTKLGASTGIGITKPGTFPNPGNYQYGIQPFIFGSDPVTGTIQKINLEQDIQTNGILQAAFVADPTDPSAGSWWQGAYNLPDLALNHPLRWSVSTVKLDPSPSNCVRLAAASTTVSCATFNSSESDIWNSEFYWMKGLLITPAITPPSAHGSGPQIMQATVGDQVQLQARVYNYSLTDMPAGSTAVVQFYGQPWDTSSQTPAGDAFLIEQVGLGPIPGFNSASTGGTQPNWTVASTDKLDTAAYSDQYLVFWVFVWMQDANGNLIGEMPGHGITEIPGTFSSITYASEYVEDYSNNVGLYHSAFYIAPQSAAPGAPVGQGDVTIEHFTVEPKRALLGEKINVSAMLRAGDQAVDGVVVKFYDGDPNNGGKAFDVEHIAHIRAHEGHQVRVPFRAETCGLHTLTVTTHPQAQTATTTLNVRIRPLPVVRDLIRQTKALALRGHDRRELLTLLRDARKLLRHRDVAGALHKLELYRARIEALRINTIPVEKAEVILAQLDLISSCIGLDLKHDMTEQELMEDQAAGHE